MERASSSTPTSEQLARCLERILEIEHVTPEDDFFALGGDSLAAKQLLVEIDNQWAIQLPATLLIEHPTVSALATLIDLRTQDHLNGAIVPIKPSGNLPPLYMTHGHGGDLWVGLSLASHLAEDQPLYGIRPDFNKRFRSFKALATQNVKSLITEHPRQDYQLIGYSFGGILAFEMARQLEASGYRVSFLGIIDSRPDLGPNLRRDTRPDSREGWARLKGRYHHDGFFQSLKWSTQWTHRWYQSKRSRESTGPIVLSLFRNSWSRIRTFFAKPNPAKPPQATREDLARLFEQKAVNAFLEYVPEPYSGDITYFATRQKIGDGEIKPGRGWSEFTSGHVEVIPVEGDHFSIARSPDIQQIVERLKQIGHERLR